MIASQARGRGFDSARPHQISFFMCLSIGPKAPGVPTQVNDRCVSPCVCRFMSSRAAFVVGVVLLMSAASSTPRTFAAGVLCSGDTEEFACVSLQGDRNTCCIKGGPNYCDPFKGCTACIGGTRGCPGTACVDFNTNAKYCGSCFHSCSAEQICCDGTCYDAQTDNDTCGRCGVSCDGGAEICRTGKCVAR
jgi:hypothetical protein